MSKERSVFSNDLHKFTLEQHVPNLFFDLQRRCSVKKGVLKNCANFTGKHLYWNLLLLKLQALQILQHRCFPVTFAKLTNTYFVENLQTAASGSCKHSIWTCYKIKDVDSTEFFRKMKPGTYKHQNKIFQDVVRRCSIQ